MFTLVAEPTLKFVGVTVTAFEPAEELLIIIFT
jgi:hypothetical protein